jgi:integrase
VTCLKRAYNWAEAEGILTSNPVKKVAKPAARARDRILTPEERLEVAAAIKDAEFGDFVFALQETGCRPSEVARVTAADVDPEQGVWTLEQHKTRKRTGKPRVVYLTPPMLELTRRLLERHPEGTLFRNLRGRAWTRNAIRCRFRRIRHRLPHLKGVISYTYRHSFATDALVNGVGAIEVAELMGHANTDMLVKHYQHLAGKRKHMLEAAVTARAARP